MSFFSAIKKLSLKKITNTINKTVKDAVSIATGVATGGVAGGAAAIAGLKKAPDGTVVVDSAPPATAAVADPHPQSGTIMILIVGALLLFLFARK